jgi:DNA primase
MGLMEPSSSHPRSHEDALREAFARHARGFLTEAAGCEEDWVAMRSFLAQRGFDLRRRESLPLGWFPNAEILRERLLRDGFTAEDIHGSGLLRDGRLPGRLVGPIRNHQGRITSFWARPPREENARTLYLNRDWRSEAVVFGLDVALPAVRDGRQDLLLVEDLLDAILLHAAGLPGVAAVGNSVKELSAGRWEQLADLGVCRVTLAAQRDGACSQAVLAAIHSAAQAKTSPAVYVLPPEVLPDGTGPADVVRSLGAESLSDLLVRQRIHGFRYLALRIAQKHKQGGPWASSAQRAALSEAAQLYASAKQRNVPQLDAFFLPALLDELGLGWYESRDCGGPVWAEEPHEDAVEAIAPAAIESSNLPPPESEPTEAAIEPQALPVNSLRPSIKQPDFCEFHQCSRQACLCWD